MSQRAGKVPWPGTGNELREPTRSKGASNEQGVSKVTRGCN